MRLCNAACQSQTKAQPPKCTRARNLQSREGLKNTRCIFLANSRAMVAHTNNDFFLMRVSPAWDVTESADFNSNRFSGQQGFDSLGSLTLSSSRSRTSPFHGENVGSIPARVTTFRSLRVKLGDFVTYRVRRVFFEIDRGEPSRLSQRKSRDAHCAHHVKPGILC